MNALAKEKAARYDRRSRSTHDDTPIVCSAQDECEHSDTRIEILPPGSVHFGRELCRDCDKVLRWLPKPATVERSRWNGYRLTKLAMSPALSAWERGFVQSISKAKHLSPRQQAKLDELCDKFQIGGQR